MTPIGNLTKIKVVKNKVAPPFKVAQVEMIYGEGISHLSEVVNLGVENWRSSTNPAPGSPTRAKRSVRAFWLSANT
jgi:hypothetical protein